MVRWKDWPSWETWQTLAELKNVLELTETYDMAQTNVQGIGHRRW